MEDLSIGSEIVLKVVESEKEECNDWTEMKELEY